MCLFQLSSGLVHVLQTCEFGINPREKYFHVYTIYLYILFCLMYSLIYMHFILFIFCFGISSVIFCLQYLSGKFPLTLLQYSKVHVFKCTKMSCETKCCVNKYKTMAAKIFHIIIQKIGVARSRTDDVFARSLSSLPLSQTSASFYNKCCS